MGKKRERLPRLNVKMVKAELMVNNDGDISRKMFDIKLDSIANNGFMEEIDTIHNNNLVQSMSFDRMMLNHIQNTMGRLNTHVNQSVLSLHNRTLKMTLFLIQNNNLFN